MLPTALILPTLLFTVAQATPLSDTPIRALAPESVPVVTALDVKLIFQPRISAGSHLHGQVMVENTGNVPCLVPLDLQPGHGFVRFDWTRADGAKQFLGQVAATSASKHVELQIGSNYGQRFSLGTTEREPCVRISGPDECRWEPGRYVFRVTVLVPPDPRGLPAGDASPRLATGSWTSAPVEVEVVP